MSEEWQAYIKDARTVCKYGSKCYQKNPEHHKNFKHPPVNNKRKGDHNSPAGKRYKPSPKPKHAKSPVKAENTSKDHDNSPSGNCFNPSPKHVKSPKAENPSKAEDDKCEEPSSGDLDKDYDQSSENNVHSEASKSNEEESYAIKLPETLTYHDKDDYSLLKELFLVDMPDDFFKFYECLQGEQDLEKTLASVNLQLIGPFDLLLGKLPVLDDKELYLVHWRFFYDPPEFQAVLKKKGKSEFHIGYFRDEPNSAPVFMAHSDSAKGCHITPMAENIFGAVYLYLQNEKKSPFTSLACQKLMEKVKKWAESHNYSLEEYNMKKRLANSLTRTFHGAGMVVPYNKKTQLGYRKLVETDANLKKLFAKLESCRTQKEKDVVLSQLQPVMTYASIAVDEGDFGAGLECGLALLAAGRRELRAAALAALQPAYGLLGRQAFSRIVEAHMKYRRKGPNMSVLSFSKP